MLVVRLNCLTISDTVHTYIKQCHSYSAWRMSWLNKDHASSETELFDNQRHCSYIRQAVSLLQCMENELVKQRPELVVILNCLTISHTVHTYVKQCHSYSA